MVHHVNQRRPTMKLNYNWNSKTFSTSAVYNEQLDEDVLRGAVMAIGVHLGIPERSVLYLRQNGWAQSLQDAYAGPRAKAIKDKESEDTINSVIEGSIRKRMDNIFIGMDANVHAGRDPVRSAAKRLVTLAVEKLGKSLPKDKDKLANLIDRYIEAHRDEVNAEVRRMREDRNKEEVSLDDLTFTE